MEGGGAGASHPEDNAMIAEMQLPSTTDVKTQLSVDTDAGDPIHEMFSQITDFLLITPRKMEKTEATPDRATRPQRDAIPEAGERIEGVEGWTPVHDRASPGGSAGVGGGAAGGAEARQKRVPGRSLVEQRQKETLATVRLAVLRLRAEPPWTAGGWVEAKGGAHWFHATVVEVDADGDRYCVAWWAEPGDADGWEDSWVTGAEIRLPRDAILAQVEVVVGRKIAQ
ncbi:hypothetical protein T484DRAFT_1772841, partial [Baffinella frigidus]